MRDNYIQRAIANSLMFSIILSVGISVFIFVLLYIFVFRDLSLMTILIAVSCGTVSGYSNHKILKEKYRGKQ